MQSENLLRSDYTSGYLENNSSGNSSNSNSPLCHSPHHSQVNMIVIYRVEVGQTQKYGFELNILNIKLNLASLWLYNLLGYQSNAYFLIVGYSVKYLLLNGVICSGFHLF